MRELVPLAVSCRGFAAAVDTASVILALVSRVSHTGFR